MSTAPLSVKGIRVEGRRWYAAKVAGTKCTDGNRLHCRGRPSRRWPSSAYSARRSFPGVMRETA